MRSAATRAVAGDHRRERARPRGDLRCERARQRRGQRRRGRCGRVGGTDAELADPAGAVVLVVMLRGDDLRCAGARGRRGRAGAAVMDDRGNPREQRLVVDVADREAIGAGVARRELRPAARHDRAPAGARGKP